MRIRPPPRDLFRLAFVPSLRRGVAVCHFDVFPCGANLGFPFPHRCGGGRFKKVFSSPYTFPPPPLNALLPLMTAPFFLNNLISPVPQVMFRRLSNPAWECDRMPDTFLSLYT